MGDPDQPQRDLLSRPNICAAACRSRDSHPADGPQASGHVKFLASPGVVIALKRWRVGNIAFSTRPPDEIMQLSNRLEGPCRSPFGSLQRARQWAECTD